MLTFDTLIAPLESESFFTDVIGKSALFLPGASDRFSYLISWSVLNSLLEFGGLCFPRLRLFRGGNEIPGDRYFRAGLSGYQRPLTQELTSELRNGATLAIESIEELHSPISDLCIAAERKLRIPVLADMYASGRDQPTTPLRWNDHDVMILQIDGERNWQVYGPTAAPGSPSPQAPLEEPAWHGTLQANGFLYIPRGWWYLDEPAADHALYLALKYKKPTGADVIAKVMKQLIVDAGMQIDIPPAGDLEKQCNFLKYIQGSLAFAAETPGLVPACLAEMRTFSQPRQGFSLPWSAHAVPLPPSPDWVIISLIRFPAATDMKHLEFEDAFEIIVDGRPVRFSEEIVSVVERILDCGELTIASLLTACVPNVQPERVMGCLVELVKSGAVSFREPRAGGDDAATLIQYTAPAFETTLQ